MDDFSAMSWRSMNEDPLRRTRETPRPGRAGAIARELSGPQPADPERVGDVPT